MTETQHQQKRLQDVRTCLQFNISHYTNTLKDLIQRILDTLDSLGRENDKLKAEIVKLNAENEILKGKLQKIHSESAPDSSAKNENLKRKRLNSGSDITSTPCSAFGAKTQKIDAQN